MSGWSQSRDWRCEFGRESSKQAEGGTLSARIMTSGLGGLVFHSRSFLTVKKMNLTLARRVQRFSADLESSSMSSVCVKAEKGMLVLYRWKLCRLIWSFYGRLVLSVSCIAARFACGDSVELLFCILPHVSADYHVLPSRKCIKFALLAVSCLSLNVGCLSDATELNFDWYDTRSSGAFWHITYLSFNRCTHNRES